MSYAAILFDVFGTLLDVHSVQQRANELFPGYGARLSQTWRDKQIEYTRLRSLSKQYATFSQVTRDALQFTCDALALPASAEQQRELMRQYDSLRTFPEVESTLARLVAHGMPLGVLSNGEPALLDTCLAAAGLRDSLSFVLSADAVRVFKTATQVYQLGVDAVGCPASDILFVSSNGWDACGATWFGYTTCWINRAGAPSERLGVTPHYTGASLQAVVDALGSTSKRLLTGDRHG